MPSGLLLGLHSLQVAQKQHTAQRPNRNRSSRTQQTGLRKSLRSQDTLRSIQTKGNSSETYGEEDDVSFSNTSFGDDSERSSFLQIARHRRNAGKIRNEVQQPEPRSIKDILKAHPDLKIEQIDTEDMYWEAKWLHSRGRGPSPHEQRAQLEKLRNWFNSLDREADGAVGVDDLLDPLISVGLVKSRDDVVRLLGVAADEADQRDPSITLDVFLNILQRKESAPGLDQADGPTEGTETWRSEVRARIAALFQLTSGDTKEGHRPLSVPVLLTMHRRKVLLDANCAPLGSPQQVEGSGILEAIIRARASGPQQAVTHQLRKRNDPTFLERPKSGGTKIPQNVAPGQIMRSTKFKFPVVTQIRL